MSTIGVIHQRPSKPAALKVAQGLPAAKTAKVQLPLASQTNEQQLYPAFHAGVMSPKAAALAANLATISSPLNASLLNSVHDQPANQAASAAIIKNLFATGGLIPGLNAQLVQNTVKSAKQARKAKATASKAASSSAAKAARGPDLGEQLAPFLASCKQLHQRYCADPTNEELSGKVQFNTAVIGLVAECMNALVTEADESSRSAQFMDLLEQVTVKLNGTLGKAMLKYSKIQQRIERYRLDQALKAAISSLETSIKNYRDSSDVSVGVEAIIGFGLIIAGCCTLNPLLVAPGVALLGSAALQGKITEHEINNLRAKVHELRAKLKQATIGGFTTELAGIARSLKIDVQHFAHKMKEITTVFQVVNAAIEIYLTLVTAGGAAELKGAKLIAYYAFVVVPTIGAVVNGVLNMVSLILSEFKDTRSDGSEVSKLAGYASDFSSVGGILSEAIEFIVHKLGLKLSANEKLCLEVGSMIINMFFMFKSMGWAEEAGKSAAEAVHVNEIELQPMGNQLNNAGLANAVDPAAANPDPAADPNNLPRSMATRMRGLLTNTERVLQEALRALGDSGMAKFANNFGAKEFAQIQLYMSVGQFLLQTLGQTENMFANTVTVANAGDNTVSANLEMELREATNDTQLNYSQLDVAMQRNNTAIAQFGTGLDSLCKGMEEDIQAKLKSISYMLLDLA